MDLLTHLHVVTADSYNTIAVSTLHSSLHAKSSPACSVFTRRFLVTAPTTVILLHPAQVLSSQAPAENLLPTDSESESELLYDWRFTVNQFILATSPSRLTTRIFFSIENLQCNSLTNERMCLSFTSAAWPRPRSHSHILLSQIRDSPNPVGQVPVFISPRNSMAQLYP
jgi:hypothetical protein